MSKRETLLQVVCRIEVIGGIPEATPEVLHPVVPDHNTFAFQQLLHQMGSPEMVLSREQSVAIDHPLSGHIPPVGSVHGITHHPGTACRTQKAGDCTVGSYAAHGYGLHHAVDAFEKGRIPS